MFKNPEKYGRVNMSALFLHTNVCKIRKWRASACERHELWVGRAWIPASGLHNSDTAYVTVTNPALFYMDTVLFIQVRIDIKTFLKFSILSYINYFPQIKFVIHCRKYNNIAMFSRKQSTKYVILVVLSLNIHYKDLSRLYYFLDLAKRVKHSLLLYKYNTYLPPMMS